LKYPRSVAFARLHPFTAVVARGGMTTLGQAMSGRHGISSNPSVSSGLQNA
jgi:hypothetical protein